MKKRLDLEVNIERNSGQTTQELEGGRVGSGKDDDDNDDDADEIQEEQTGGLL